MAGGYRCKHCGWQEATHEGGAFEEESFLYEKRKRGYRMSLVECLKNEGFTASKRDAKDEQRESILAQADEDVREQFRRERSYFD